MASQRARKVDAPARERGTIAPEAVEVRLIPPDQDDPVALAAVVEWTRRVLEQRHGVAFEDYVSLSRWSDLAYLVDIFEVPAAVVRRAIASGELRPKRSGSVTWLRDDVWLRWYGGLEAGRSGAGRVVVYFARDGEHIKIGRAQTDADARLLTLSTGNPRLIVLLATMPGTNETEAALHRKFRRLRVRGEWFRAEPALLEFIAAIEAGG